MATKGMITKPSTVKGQLSAASVIKPIKAPARDGLAKTASSLSKRFIGG